MELADQQTVAADGARARDDRRENSILLAEVLDYHV